MSAAPESPAGKARAAAAESLGDGSAASAATSSSSSSSPPASSSSSSSAASLQEATDESKSKNRTKLLVAGFLGGFLQAGLFNPWDRALYLSISEQRPFLDLKNFHRPYHGVSQTIFQRALSSGMYFPLEEIFADNIVASGVFGTSATQISENRTWVALIAGLCAGMTNGFVMNPLAAVKYNFWGRSPAHRTRSFLDAGKEMYLKGGLRIYYVGAAATICRDLVFGGVYGVLRHEMPMILDNLAGTSSRRHSSYDGTVPGNDSGATSDSREVFHAKPSFTVNLFAAMIATVLSSPWNYIRNIHYATPYGQDPEKPLSIMRGLWKDACKEKSLFGRLVHLQTNLRVGWGTARVGCGMAFSAQVYNFVSHQMS
jgi:hypothetical protein